MSVASAPPAPVPSAKKAEPTRASEDWQTAFVWAFIVKFHQNIVGKGGLSTVMDLEIALMCSQEDDVLNFVFQKMILALKDCGRDLKPSTMPKHLFRVLDSYIAQSPWSTYHDVPRVPEAEYTRVNHMAPPEAEAYLKTLNPLRNAMSDAALDGDVPKEGQAGYFEQVGALFWRWDWREKLRLLRQLVDWQLVHSAPVRSEIATEYNIVHQKAMNFKKESNRLIIEPIAQDRTKKRYWSLDDSPRIYTSANPFKKNCPLTPIASSKDDLLALTQRLRTENEFFPPPPPPEGVADAALQQPLDAAASGPAKKKVKVEKEKKNPKQHDGEIRIIRFIEEEHLPRVEKEILRQENARKKAQKQAIMQAQAEHYATRTRRTRKHVDYKAIENGTSYAEAESSDDDNGRDGDSDDGAYSNAESEGSNRRRSGRLAAPPARASGSRRSNRLELRDDDDELQEALRQSAREAEVEAAMRGGSRSGEDDDDDDAGEEDDEAKGLIVKKRAYVVESDEETAETTGGVPSEFITNGTATPLPPPSDHNGVPPSADAEVKVVDVEVEV